MCIILCFACVVQEGDKLLWVGQCQQDSSVLLASSGGKALHMVTNNDQIRPLSRTAQGIKVHFAFALHVAFM